MAFRSDREIKMPRNVVFRVNYEIKIPEKSHSAKISYLKIM